MTYTVRIENSDTEAPAEGGDTILDTLLMAGVGFAYSCQAGNCGTCRCELVSGDIAELEYSEHALSPAERARNIVLACRSQVWGDVVVRKLDEEEFVVHPSRVLRCAVTTLERATHDIWFLRLEVLSGGPFSFTAGQYASLTFPFAPDSPRDYSMANAPGEPGLEFHIREMPAGSVSAGLGSRLKAGDIVRVAGPMGTAYLREKHTGPVIAIAGGSGLAPIRSILRSMRQRGLANPLHAYFGVRSERDVYGEDDLRAAAREVPGSAAHVVLSEGEGGARRTGLVTAAVDADFSTLDGFKAYVAGPPAMVEAAVALLSDKGVAARDIHADAFYPAGGPSPRGLDTNHGGTTA